jgi:hypothetical protein
MRLTMHISIISYRFVAVKSTFSRLNIYLLLQKSIVIGIGKKFYSFLKRPIDFCPDHDNQDWRPQNEDNEASSQIVIDVTKPSQLCRATRQQKQTKFT